jgi:hypothetical protein
MGTPLETGSLVIRGCIIKITGFAEQEFLNEKPEIKKVEQPKNSKDIIQPSKESERFKYRLDVRVLFHVNCLLNSLLVVFKLYANLPKQASHYNRKPYYSILIILNIRR